MGVSRSTIDEAGPGGLWEPRPGLGRSPRRRRRALEGGAAYSGLAEAVAGPGGSKGPDLSGRVAGRRVNTGGPPWMLGVSRSAIDNAGPKGPVGAAAWIFGDFPGGGGAPWRGRLCTPGLQS